MTPQETINFVAGRVQSFFESDSSGHDWQHTLRVWHLARQLAEEEQADVFICELAALLHDADDYKLTGEDEAARPVRGAAILTEAGVTAEVRDTVVDIVGRIGFHTSFHAAKFQDLEAQIVYDADKLEAMGATGIARCFAYGGKKGRTLFGPTLFPIENISKDVYLDENRPENTSINHFFDKLLTLNSRLYTAAGRQEGVRRHRLMVTFLEEFFREQGAADWQAFLEKFLENK